MRRYQKVEEERGRKGELGSAFHIPAKVELCLVKGERVEKVDGEEERNDGEGKEVRWREEEVRRSTEEEEEAGLEEELGALVQHMQGSQC